MAIAIVRAEHEELSHALTRLIPVEPDLPYANFAPIRSRSGAVESLYRELWGAPALANWIAYEGKTPLAAIRVEERPFESAHFGRRCARLTLPIACAERDLRHRALHDLYARVLTELERDGYQHAAARASTRDRAASWALQENGLFHVDTQVSWMCAFTGTPHDESLPPPLRCEIHDRDGLSRLAPASWQALADWAGTAFDRGPFVFDLDVPFESACAIYREWTEKVMTGEWADAVGLVRRENDGQVVAFISMMTMPEVSAAAGVHVTGRGLAATLPGYRGLFTAIQREFVRVQPLGAQFQENETQVATIGSINVYAKLGMRYLRSTSSFHRQLDRRRQRR